MFVLDSKRSESQKMTLIYTFTSILKPQNFDLKFQRQIFHTFLQLLFLNSKLNIIIQASMF